MPFVSEHGILDYLNEVVDDSLFSYRMRDQFIKTNPVLLKCLDNQLLEYGFPNDFHDECFVVYGLLEFHGGLYDVKAKTCSQSLNPIIQGEKRPYLDVILKEMIQENLHLTRFLATNLLKQSSDPILSFETIALMYKMLRNEADKYRSSSIH